MAHANIYIRKENELAWNGITNKSDWVNERLSIWHPLMGISDTAVGNVGKTPEVLKEAKEYAERGDTAAANMFASVLDIPGVVKASELKMCKIHNTPLTSNGRCLQKGCKYA